MSPAQSIDRAKTQRIRDAARAWLKQQGALHEITDLRFDAASVTFDTPGGRLAYYEGAF